MTARRWPAVVVVAVVVVGFVVVAVACGGGDDRLEAEATRLSRQGDAKELVAVRGRLQERLRARRRGTDRATEARTLEALAEVTDALGDRVEALSLLESALSLEEAQQPGRTSRLRARIAQVLLASDDAARAGRVIAEGLALAASSNDVIGRARGLHARAELRIRGELFGRARTDLGEALQLFRAAGDAGWTARSLLALGTCASGEGQDVDARRLLEESRALFQRIGDRRGEAETLLGLSFVAVQFEHDLASGRRYADEAVAMARRTGDLTSLAYGLDYFGVIERMQGRAEAALPWHREALELRRRMHDRRGEAETLFSLGTALHVVGRLDESIEMVEASVATFHELGDGDREGVVLWQLARGLQKAGRLDEATALADRSLALRDAFRRRIAVPARRALYADDIGGGYDLAVGLRIQRAARDGDPRLVEEALLLSERARARSLVETLALAAVRAGDDPAARRQAAIQQEVEVLEDQLDGIEVTERRAQLEQTIDARLAEYADLESRREAAPSPSRPSDGADALDLSRLRAALEPDTLVLEYYVGSASSGSLVWAITRDEIAAVHLGDPAALDQASRSLYASVTARAAAQGGGEGAVERRASELAAMLLGPLAKQLAGKRRVVIVTDGALSYVPFGLLPDERGAPLGLGREVYYVPSLTTLVALRARRAAAATPTAGLIIYGDPVFSADDARLHTAIASVDGASRVGRGLLAPQVPGPGGEGGLTRALQDIGLASLARLPYTREEASRIASLLPGGSSLRLGVAAQKQSIIDGALRGQRWIHLATHGIMDSKHPERSGLVFSRFDETGAQVDGYLRLREIYELSLSAELVVLSACQTAVGREVRRDGLLSVTRGFLHAGAHTVLATLWPVDDRATSELMAELYRGLLVDGLSPGQALSRAKRFMRASARYHAPYYWAGFELYGDWQPRTPAPRTF